mgnify:FL=1
MNEYDRNRILDITKKNKFSSTKNIEEADCYVLNTCHIREKATDKVYHEVGRIKKRLKGRKKPIVLIAGCVAQAEGDILIRKEKYIDAVIGPQSYHQINSIISSIEKKKEKINLTEFDTIEKFDSLNKIKNTNSKISSFVTIQEGCDKFCKFCVVPYTRGPECSRPFSQIIAEAKQLVLNGSKEITLLGQNVNAYNFGEKKLSNLIYSLNEIKELKRIRYTTSHPNDFTDDLIEVHATCDKLMPVLHLPVQSGSTKILKRMNRKHSYEDYIDLVDKLSKKKKTIKFSSDFIIGYPGENEEDFNQTLSLMKKIKFINSYSFIFSSRPGTPAAKFKKVDQNIAKDRLIIFQRLADQIKNEYRANLLNKSVKVLFENKMKNEDKYFGRDEYFNSVVVKSNKNLIGKIENIKIQNFNQNTLFGDLMENKKEVYNAA